MCIVHMHTAFDQGGVTASQTALLYQGQGFIGIPAGASVPLKVLLMAPASTICHLAGSRVLYRQPW
jgi:hypothetical protein